MGEVWLLGSLCLYFYLPVDKHLGKNKMFAEMSVNVQPALHTIHLKLVENFCHLGHAFLRIPTCYTEAACP